MLGGGKKAFGLGRIRWLLNLFFEYKIRATTSKGANSRGS